MDTLENLLKVIIIQELERFFFFMEVHFKKKRLGGSLLNNYTIQILKEVFASNFLINLFKINISTNHLLVYSEFEVVFDRIQRQQLVRT